MTNHLHTTIHKIHFWLFGWVFRGTQVSIKYFKESINRKKRISQKIAVKSETFLWKRVSVSHTLSCYSVMNVLFTIVSAAMTVLLWKNTVDYSLSCASTEMSGMIWLSKPSVPKWRKRLNKCTSVFDPQVETTKLVARQKPPSWYAKEQNFIGCWDLSSLQELVAKFQPLIP